MKFKIVIILLICISQNLKAQYEFKGDFEFSPEEPVLIF